MSATFSVFRLTDGVFTGLILSGSEDVIAYNLPGGCGVWPGEHDANRVRVDLVSQALIPYQPPAPAADAWCTWAWDAQQWAWRPVPTLAALKAAALLQVDGAISAVELRQQRPARELLLATASVNAVAAAAATERLALLDAEIADLRATRAAAAAASDPEELAGIVLP